MTAECRGLFGNVYHKVWLQNCSKIYCVHKIWPSIRMSVELVSEEPGTESLGIFHQGGVQDLSTAVFGWKRSPVICGDHLHLHTEGRSTIGR